MKEFVFYRQYMEGWNEQDIARQERIIRRSNKVVYVCQEKEGAFLARDRKPICCLAFSFLAVFVVKKADAKASARYIRQSVSRPD